MLRPSAGAVLLLTAGAALGAPPPAPPEPLPAGAVARLGSTRIRHIAAVSAVAFAPDGRTLYAAAPEEHMVRAWDVATGRELRRFVQKTGVHKFAVSPDGKSLATADESDADRDTILIWDTATGKERLRIEAKLQFCLAFSPDGRTLFGGGGPLNPTIARWDAATGEKLPDFARHKQFWTEVLAFSPDGKTLATEEIGGVHVWDVATGKQKYAAAPGKGHNKGLAFSPDGKLLVGGWDESLVIWEAATGKEQRRIEVGRPWIMSAALAPDGKTIGAGLWDGTVRLLDAGTGKELARLPGHEGVVQAVAFSPDGKTLASGSEDQGVKLWDVATRRERLATGSAGKVHHLAFTPDGRTVATGGSDGALRLWDPATGEERRRLAEQEQQDVCDVFGLTFSPDGRWLASAGQDQTVRLWDPRTGREILRGKYKEPVVGASFSPDGRTLTSGGSDGVRLWDVPAEVPEGGQDGPREWKGRELPLPERCSLRWLSLTPDGRRLVIVQDRGPLLVGDLKDGTFRPVGDPRDGPADNTLQRQLTPDGRTLLALRCTPEGGQVWRWNLRTGECRDALSRRLAVVQATLSADGRSVATAGADGVIRLWELATGQERRHWPSACEGEPTAMAFAPDGRTLAVAGADRTVLVWDTLPAPPERTPEACWADLGGDDAAAAYGAIARLAVAPRESVPFLAKRLRPVPATSAEQIRRWIADLDAEAFPTREAAQTELERLGGAAEAALRQAYQSGPTPEARRRLERLCAGLDADTAPSGQLQALRALEALERSGSAEAVPLLRELAGGAEGAWLTEEARVALRRLERRTGPRLAPPSASFPSPR